MDCGFAEAEFFVDMLCSCVFEVGIKKNNVGSHAEHFFYERMLSTTLPMPFSW